MVPFNWTAYNSLPLPGMTELAGRLMASSIIVQAGTELFPQMKPNDVIALHMIGHSRGSTVISQAALDIENFVAEHPDWSRLAAGPWKMTFLDPHPAHNIPGQKWYDAAPNLLGQIGTAVYTQFQDVANDPPVVVPGSVDWAEVYYQHTLTSQAADPVERIFISWGEIPVHPESSTTIVNYCDLTGTVFGHYAVHTWYQDVVVPKLGTDPGFVCPNGGTSMPGLGSDRVLSYFDPASHAFEAWSLDKIMSNSVWPRRPYVEPGRHP